MPGLTAGPARSIVAWCGVLASHGSACSSRPASMAPIPVAGAVTDQAPTPLPPPVAGKTVNAQVMAGKVRYRLPGHERVRRPHRSAAAPDRDDLRHHGGARDADLGQRHQGRDPARVVLRGHLHARPDDRARSRSRRSRSPARCRTARRGRAPRRRRASASRAICGATARGASARAGASASATVRGTRWVVSDRCDGTLIRVVRGSVTVRDRVRNKTVVIREGEQYLVRRPGSTTP